LPKVAKAANGTPLLRWKHNHHHGCPNPQTFEVRARSKQTLRRGRCYSADIAVIDGGLDIGLEDQRVTAPAQAKMSRTVACDMAAVCHGRSGAPRLPPTMDRRPFWPTIAFRHCGIGGGIGCGNSFDISADLMELAKRGDRVACRARPF